jgi:hypothetical protein
MRGSRSSTARTSASGSLALPSQVQGTSQLEPRGVVVGIELERRDERGDAVVHESRAQFVRAQERRDVGVTRPVGGAPAQQREPATQVPAEDALLGVGQHAFERLVAGCQRAAKPGCRLVDACRSQSRERVLDRRHLGRGGR